MRASWIVLWALLAMTTPQYAFSLLGSRFLPLSLPVLPVLPVGRGAGRWKSVRVAPSSLTMSTTTPVIITPSETQDWLTAATDSLRYNGMCVLRTGSELPGSSLHLCYESAVSRLEDMLRRVDARGHDTEEEAWRFEEILHREAGGRRYEMPLPWCGVGSSDEPGGVSMSKVERRNFKQIHSHIHKYALPVLEGLWGSVSPEAPVSGCLVSKAGATAQGWHKDGHMEGHMDVFCPLKTLTPAHGPTELVPTSHVNALASDAWLPGELEQSQGVVLNGDFDAKEARHHYPSVAPLLQAGDLLFFDYRTVHRGGPNTCDYRPVAYAVYSSRDTGRDRHNFPDALTLQYD